MSAQLFAFCGLDCGQCPAYIATQANDVAKLAALAQEWFDGSTDHTIVLCDGCKPNDRDAHLMKWCSECPTRACALERGLENCAYCEDYGCPKVRMVFDHAPEAEANLDKIRGTIH
jgi:hypothetical protein